MDHNITVQSLAILVALDTLGPACPTSNAAEYIARAGLPMTRQGGSKRVSLDGSLRQALRCHERAGRVVREAIPGHGRGGEVYVWSLTQRGKRDMESYLTALRRATSIAGMIP